MDIGQLKGVGLAALTEPIEVNAWLINPGLAGWLEGRIVGPLAAHLMAGAFVPVHRPWFYFTDLDAGPADQTEDIHRVPGIGVMADLGLSVRFP